MSDLSPPAKRAPPAFQVYASDELASEQYFGLGLAERGLMDAMRRACWVSEDGSIPADPALLAVVVRRPEAEVRLALSDSVLTWFLVGPGRQRLVEPDLQRQRVAWKAKRQAQSNGAKSTNTFLRTMRDKKLADGAVSETVSEPLLNRIEKTRKESTSACELSEDSDKSWVDEYVEHENFPSEKAPASGE
jgi:hypothetical protein